MCKCLNAIQHVQALTYYTKDKKNKDIFLDSTTTILMDIVRTIVTIA